MKHLRDFKEYIDDLIVKEQKPDRARINSLLKESKTGFDNLNLIIKAFGVTDANANLIIKLSYDIIMEQVRAKMLNLGFNAAGPGAHEAEVAFLREINVPESIVHFCNQLRYFRNGILYLTLLSFSL